MSQFELDPSRLTDEQRAAWRRFVEGAVESSDARQRAALQALFDGGRLVRRDDERGK